MNEQRLYTVANAAEVLKVSKSTIKNYMKSVAPEEITTQEVRGQQWLYMTETALETIRQAMEKNAIPEEPDRTEPHNGTAQDRTTPSREGEGLTGEPSTDPENTEQGTEKDRTGTEQDQTKPGNLSEVEWLRKQVDRLLDQAEQDHRQIEQLLTQNTALTDALGRSQIMQADLQRRLTAPREEDAQPGTVDAVDAVETPEPTEPAADPDGGELAAIRRENAAQQEEIEKLRQALAEEREINALPWWKRRRKKKGGA